MAADQTQRKFLEPAVLARLAAVPLFARRPMQGNVSGRHTSPHRGTSVEFAEYRKYVPGDDLRRLDWRAHGRTDRYYIKEFEADTNLRCCLVIDTSGSMKFGSTGITKFEYAQRLAAAISYLAIQQGDAAGLACVSDGIVTEIPAKRNPAHLRLMFDLLEKAKPTGPTRLIESLHQLAETISQRALVIIISDFFVPPEELRQCFEHFRFRKHDLAAFHLLDPQEVEFKFQRPTRFLDPEGGPAIFAEPSEIADRYHKALTAYLTEVKHAVDTSGVDYHRVLINESYDAGLMRFLAGRSKAGGVR
ncbi:DUF58 domain-containing protein [Blastopirellula marina]|uniref:DUF58 domain-containing protein n=1 Tax=Blastopirellula marina TaxID=124 RepID=A0A2S8FAW4_9BACT|nr:DUF58 domain-containing protein [Blastopirellula marina]PQO29074.1 DUF58 domain-containing protein [Blastopirellula marina]PTL42346.1 DUF58 domain-containing protein [Blastopirellula marina]